MALQPFRHRVHRRIHLMFVLSVAGVHLEAALHLADECVRDAADVWTVLLHPLQRRLRERGHDDPVGRIARLIRNPEHLLRESRGEMLEVEPHPLLHALRDLKRLRQGHDRFVRVPAAREVSAAFADFGKRMIGNLHVPLHHRLERTIVLKDHMSVLRLPQVELEIIELVLRGKAIGGLGVARGERLLPLVRNVGDRVFNPVHMNGERRKDIRNLPAGNRNGAVFPQHLRLCRTHAKIEFGLDFRKRAVHRDEIRLAAVALHEHGYRFVAKHVLLRTGDDLRWRRLRRGARHQHGGKLSQAGDEVRYVAPCLGRCGHAVVVTLLRRIHNAAVGVPGYAVGAVGYRRECHGEQLFLRREPLPRSPALEVLDDRPDGVRPVVLRIRDIELEPLHVAYRDRDTSFERHRLLRVHWIYLRHEHVGHLDERPIAGDRVSTVHHICLACDARRIDRPYSIHAVVYLLRGVVHGRIVPDVPRENGRVPAERLDEIRAGDPRPRPGLEPMSVGKIEKSLRRAACVGMDEIEASPGDIAHRLFDALPVQRQRTQPVESDREERLIVDKRDAIVAQRHVLRALCHLSAEEHLFGGDGRAVLRIRQRNLRRVDAFAPFSAWTVG